jgi:peptide/nickel transport system permease protein
VEGQRLSWIVGRRLVGAVAAVILTTAVAWLLLHALRPELFAPQPSWQTQFWEYLRDAFGHFDLGTTRGGIDVAQLVRQSVPADLSLFAGGIAFGLGVGLVGGAYAARGGRGPLAWLIQLLAMIAMCTPVYVVGLSLLLLFGAEIAVINLGVGIPLKYVPFSESPARWLGAMIVPWIVLGLPLAGMTLRSMYGATREALEQEPVRTARAKGLSERSILLGHAAPLGASSTLALVGSSANIMLTNMILTERVFAVPGVFLTVPQAIAGADIALLLALTMVGAAFVTLTATVMDLTLAWLDPRVRA